MWGFCIPISFQQRKTSIQVHMFFLRKHQNLPGLPLLKIRNANIWNTAQVVMESLYKHTMTVFFIVRIKKSFHGQTRFRLGLQSWLKHSVIWCGMYGAVTDTKQLQSMIWARTTHILTKTLQIANESSSLNRRCQHRLDSCLTITCTCRDRDKIAFDTAIVVFIWTFLIGLGC